MTMRQDAPGAEGAPEDAALVPSDDKPDPEDALDGCQTNAAVIPNKTGPATQTRRYTPACLKSGLVGIRNRYRSPEATPEMPYYPPPAAILMTSLAATMMTAKYAMYAKTLRNRGPPILRVSEAPICAPTVEPTSRPRTRNEVDVAFQSVGKRAISRREYDFEQVGAHGNRRGAADDVDESRHPDETASDPEQAGEHARREPTPKMTHREMEAMPERGNEIIGRNRSAESCCTTQFFWMSSVPPALRLARAARDSRSPTVPIQAKSAM